MERYRGTDSDTKQAIERTSPDLNRVSVVVPRRTQSGVKIHETFVRIPRRTTTPIEGPKPDGQS